MIALEEIATHCCRSNIKTALISEEVPDDADISVYRAGKDGGKPLQKCILKQLSKLCIVYLSREQAYDVKSLHVILHYTVKINQVESLKRKVVEAGKEYEEYDSSKTYTDPKCSFWSSTTLLPTKIASKVLIWRKLITWCWKMANHCNTCVVTKVMLFYMLVLALR